MGFVAVFSSDRGLQARARTLLGDRHAVAAVASWVRALRLVRERPVTTLVMHEAALGIGEAERAVQHLSDRFPSVRLVYLADGISCPETLLRLGRSPVARLLLASVDRLDARLPEVVAASSPGSADALVTRTLSPYLPPREVETVRRALEGALRGWSTEVLARASGVTRPHLSVQLREVGLPSAGRLLLWGKLLHAGGWLTDPGRSAQSVARQLDYSSGAAFRRALRHYTGATPSQVRHGGGTGFVLDRFVEACGLRGTVLGRSAA